MLPRTLLSPLAAILLLASCLAGCGEERVVYDRLDASAWGSGCTDPGIPDGGLGYVTNSLMNSVAVLDLGAGTVRATHPIGVGPLAENGPHHLAVDLARSVLYSPLSFPAAAIPAGPHAEHGSSDTPGIFVKRSLCDFRLLGQVDVDPNPGDMVLSADGRTAYVSHFDLRRAQANVGDPERQKSNLIVIDTATMTRTATIPVCVAAHGMVVSSDGRTVFMACYGDDALGVVSLDGPRPTVRLVHIGGSPPWPRRAWPPFTSPSPRWMPNWRAGWSRALPHRTDAFAPSRRWPAPACRWVSAWRHRSRSSIPTWSRCCKPREMPVPRAPSTPCCAYPGSSTPCSSSGSGSITHNAPRG